MKKLLAITVLAVASSPVLADPWGKGNLDAYGSILNDDAMSFVGTSLADNAPKVSIYGGFASQETMDGFRVGRTGPEKGSNDEYGSILVEEGIRPE